jgi:Protein of unknown function (DUF1554)
MKAVLCLLLLGAVTTAGANEIVGSVPDRPSVGTPLRVAKNAGIPSHLDLSWGDSCGPEQTNFAVYEGTIGTWYSHTSRLCTTGGALAATNLTPSAASSYYLVVPLSATNEGSYGKNSAGAEIPRGTAVCRANQSTDGCNQFIRVFLSGPAYQGNLGNLGGADLKCQDLAVGAGLGGTWKAWLSSSSQNAASRLLHSNLSYRRLDGAMIALNAAGFFSNTHLAPIVLDEHLSNLGSVEVWTGSDGSGVGSGGCADWTSSNSGSVFPAVGLSDQTDPQWSNAYLNFCDRFGHLYCIEQ